MKHDNDQLDARLQEFYSGDVPVLTFDENWVTKTGRGGLGVRWLNRGYVTALVGVLVVAMISVIWVGYSNRHSPRNLMAGIQASHIAIDMQDADLGPAMSDFGVGLLRQVLEPGQNCLVSPLSAEMALAMTANGANGHTLAQMLEVLAGGAYLTQLNAYLKEYAGNLPNEKNARLQMANSIWYNNQQKMDITSGFLQANADWFDAGAYAAPFNAQTVKDMNNWVAKYTDNMIKDLVKSLDPEMSAMVLLNALAFNAKWQQPYYDSNIVDDTFTAGNGVSQAAQFMHSTESTYLDDGKATGFVKPYDQDGYRFVALLPKVGVSISDYLASLNWLATMGTATPDAVEVALPEFGFDYSVKMNDALSAMGMPDAFSDAADFSPMGTMNGQPLHIGMVQQKTYIGVTPLGTTAGAATEVEMIAASQMVALKQVTLDRPFIFAIVDSRSELPIFVGVVNSVDG